MWQFAEAIDGMSCGVHRARHPGGRRQRELLQRVARPRHRPDPGGRCGRRDRRAHRRTAARRIHRRRRHRGARCGRHARSELGGSEWATLHDSAGACLPRRLRCGHRVARSRRALWSASVRWTACTTAPTAALRSRSRRWPSPVTCGVQLDADARRLDVVRASPVVRGSRRRRPSGLAGSSPGWPPPSAGHGARHRHRRPAASPPMPSTWRSPRRPRPGASRFRSRSRNEPVHA